MPAVLDDSALDRLSVEELRNEFHRWRLFSAEGIATCVRILRKLRERGEDVDSLAPRQLQAWMSLVDGGTLIPEIFATSHDHRVINAAATMPTEVQREIVAGTPVAVVMEVDDEPVMMDPREVLRTQRQAVAPNGFRTVEQQREVIAHRASKPAPPIVRDEVESVMLSEGQIKITLSGNVHRLSIQDARAICVSLAKVLLSTMDGGLLRMALSRLLRGKA